MWKVNKIGFKKSKANFKTKKEAVDWAKHVMPHVGYRITKVKKKTTTKRRKK